MREKVVEREQLAQKCGQTFSCDLAGMSYSTYNFWTSFLSGSPFEPEKKLSHSRLFALLGLDSHTLKETAQLYISTLKSWHIRCVCENRECWVCSAFGRERDTFSFLEVYIPLSWAQLKATSKQSLAQQQHWPSGHGENQSHKNTAKYCITPIFRWVIYIYIFLFSHPGETN